MRQSFYMVLFFLLLISGIILCSFQEPTADRSPLEIAQSVADKIVRESQFDFDVVDQKSVLGMQVLNFGELFDGNSRNVSYARSSISSQKDTTSLLGISCAGYTRIWLNGSEIYKQEKIKKADIRELSYNRFSFNDTIKIMLKQGENTILVKFLTAGEEKKVYLRLLTPEGDENSAHRFALLKDSPPLRNNDWLFVGPFSSDETEDHLRIFNKSFEPEDQIMPYYHHNDRINSWQPAPPRTLLKLKIEKDNTYQRDSFLEWHYATGAMMWAILRYADVSEKQQYRDFVDEFGRFTIQHYDYFKWQYQSLGALRGSNHRLFRGTMLDDTGAPALPFAVMANSNDRFHPLIEKISKYVLHEQVRLADGTFCRPEPELNTVWADDLFMSVPFLLEMGKLSGENKYFDDVVFQIRNFYTYLFKKEKGLVHHGWFNEWRENSTVFWGRANGWMIWATSEALEVLPKDYKGYDEILSLYKAHIKGLISYQDQSGMWHQVLDHPESYEETSCTAMYCLAIARGVRNGWLKQEIAIHSTRAWNALQKKISTSGTVAGICRGTGIGEDLEFYFTRQTFDQDPRGLGAVITAGIEMEKLQKMLIKKTHP